MLGGLCSCSSGTEQVDVGIPPEPDPPEPPAAGDGRISGRMTGTTVVADLVVELSGPVDRVTTTDTNGPVRVLGAPIRQLSRHARALADRALHSGLGDGVVER